MKSPAHFPTVRLLTGGALILALVAWVGMFEGVVGGMFRLGITALICVTAIVVLTPVVWHGPKGDRWLAALLAMGPLLIFSVVAWRFSGRALY